MVSNSEKLSKWAILSLQEPTLLDSVKLAYVCDGGNQAFLVTKDDDVFTIGTSTYVPYYITYGYMYATSVYIIACLPFSQSWTTCNIAIIHYMHASMCIMHNII